jgi:hypothetical protein
LAYEHFALVRRRVSRNIPLRVLSDLDTFLPLFQFLCFFLDSSSSLFIDIIPCHYTTKGHQAHSFIRNQSTYKMHAFIPIVALLGLAAAQSDTTTTAASSTNSASSVASCIAACDAGDVNCQAVCVNVPAPNESQILATNECSTNECTQGDGSADDTKKYGECLASCASQYYYVSGGTPTGVATAQSSATGASTPVSGSAGTTTTSGSMMSSSSSASQTGSTDSSSDSSESSASSTASNAGGKFLRSCVQKLDADIVFFRIRSFIHL